tara:strand:- start:1577 stop:1903 length:327 start_codon:yes stop_codon:yes gene_type:complete
MTTTYKVLGQVAPLAATLTTLYTTPAATSTVFSTLVACNQGAETSFRVAVRPAGATLSAEQYIVYDNLLAANDSVFLTLGIALSATDVISVYAGTATVSFNVYGSEIA